MRIGVPVLKGRVAPRCTIAEGLLVVTVRQGKIVSRRLVPPDGSNWYDLLAQLQRLRIETVVCGGISRDQRDSLAARNIGLIADVACSVEELLPAIAAGRLRQGFGFADTGADAADGEARTADAGTPAADLLAENLVDCLSCTRQICLQGAACDAGAGTADPVADTETGQLLEAARDVTFERERTLCRLSEIIFFGLEMKYRRLGLAYCTDLQEPARILAETLRRYFEVVPVCCKIGGRPIAEPGFVSQRSEAARQSVITCNPLGQARALNDAGTDFNIVVGLCVGVDSVFARASDAPVTTLFVKDKSLANNPIGALYSDYYLREAAGAPFAHS